MSYKCFERIFFFWGDTCAINSRFFWQNWNSRNLGEQFFTMSKSLLLINGFKCLFWTLKQQISLLSGFPPCWISRLLIFQSVFKIFKSNAKKSLGKTSKNWVISWTTNKQNLYHMLLSSLTLPSILFKR